MEFYTDIPLLLVRSVYLTNVHTSIIFRVVKYYEKDRVSTFVLPTRHFAG